MRRFRLALVAALAALAASGWSDLRPPSWRPPALERWFEAAGPIRGAASVVWLVALVAGLYLLALGAAAGLCQARGFWRALRVVRAMTPRPARALLGTGVGLTVLAGGVAFTGVATAAPAPPPVLQRIGAAATTGAASGAARPSAASSTTSTSATTLTPGTPSTSGTTIALPAGVPPAPPTTSPPPAGSDSPPVLRRLPPDGPPALAPPSAGGSGGRSADGSTSGSTPSATAGGSTSGSTPYATADAGGPSPTTPTTANPRTVSPTPAAEGAPGTGGAPQPSSRAVAGPGRPVAPATWTIRRGDHLWLVASTTLARAWDQTPSRAAVASYWLNLIQVNRAHLADPGNPDLVFTGQVIQLPPPPPAP